MSGGEHGINEDEGWGEAHKFSKSTPQKGIAAKVYKVNQSKVDEACGELALLILELASREKLVTIKGQIEHKLKGKP
jgi:hypothetical protein